jgi:ABC-type amino acid transport system permease subunit
VSIINIFSEFHEAIISGLIVTLKLCLIIWISGICLGTILGVAGAKWRRSVGFTSRTASFILSSIPVLAFLFWLHYPLQALLEVVVDPFYTAAAALSIINILVVGDMIRDVLKDFPLQYIAAAKICGLTSAQTLIHIQLPIVLRQILPNLLVGQVYMLQATLFASLISVDEIFRVAQRINATVYKPVEIYTALAVLFLCICLPLNGLALWLRNRYTRDLSEI